MSQAKTMREIVKIIAGHPFRGSISDLPDGEVRVVQMRDVDASGGVNWEGTVHTNLTGRRKPDYLKPGDVLLLSRGSHNYAIHLNEVPYRAVCSPHFFLLRVKAGAGLLPAFLAWQLNQTPAQMYFAMNATGTAQLSLNKPALEALPLVVPALSLQEQVVALDNIARREAEAYKQLMENRQRMLRSIASDVLGK